MLARRAELTDAVAARFDAAEAAGRGLTDEEREANTVAEREIEVLSGDIAVAERNRERVRMLEGTRAPAGESGIIGAGITNVKDLRTEKPWKSAGEWAMAVARSGLQRGTDPRLVEAAATGMGEAVGADGGFAVPIEFASGIEKEMWETGQILSRVQERPISGNAISYNVIDETSRATGSRRGAVQGYWVDEGTAPDASSVKLAKVEMKLRKLAALGYITEELIEDAPALEAELHSAFVEELTFMVEDAVIEGLGAGSPLGILKAPCLISVSKEAGQAAATLIFENIQNMWSRMTAKARANAVWLINQDTEPQLNSMSLVIGTGGVPVYLPPGGLASSPLASLMGRPVIPVEYCSTLGTVGDIILSDLSRYRLIRKAQGIQYSSSMHVRFTQGETAFRATYRVDGQPIPRSAITPFKGTVTTSPFVALATRA